MHWNGDWHMGWMGIWWILIVPVVISVMWFAVSAARRGSGDRWSPEQVLKHRYGQGEIDRETYERMLEDLRK